MARALLCLSLLFASSFAAKAQAPAPGASALAGVTFPDASRNWSADPDGSKRSELDLAAAVLARGCGSREYHLWPARDANAASGVRERTDRALVDGGWSLDPVSRNDDGRRIYLATRSGAQLVVVWLPTEQGIGLLLCAAQRLEGDPNAPAVNDGVAASTAPPAANSSSSGGPPPPASSSSDAASPAADAVPADAPPAATTTEDAAAPAGDPPANTGDGQAATAGKGDREAPAINALPRTDVGPAPVITGTDAGAAAPAAAGRDPWFRLLAWLAALILAVGGAALILRSIRARQDESEIAWPTTNAEVLESGVDERTDAQGVLFEPVVVYRYMVEGEAYESRQIRLDDMGKDSYEAAEAIADRYPIGTEIEVRYHPLDPSSAAIETDRKGSELGLAIGIVCLVLAVGVFFLLG